MADGQKRQERQRDGDDHHERDALIRLAIWIVRLIIIEIGRTLRA